MDELSGWLFLTRWGNSVLLLPTAACLFVGLFASGERRVAWRWAVCFGAAVLLVTATKLAFLGWDIGIERLDFTGISGHTTLASSVLPVLAWWLVRDRSSSMRRAVVAAGSLLALAIAVSRVVLGTHSPSEVVVGYALGSLVAWVVIPRAPSGRGGRVGRAFAWFVLAALIVGGIVPGPGESEEAHGLVVRLALQWSGRSEPFVRGQWRGAWLDDGRMNVPVVDARMPRNPAIDLRIAREVATITR